ncbi:putative siderochrome-iron transporter [Gregarina niphandrodes]|uniref:Siderochrome-iron transporter n=1 Tax=Gregarina niphandrodes TaxID=110365 RepID=A0A023B783_GRENI|nr:putative siderochrome-iron transporter [Gregarina niphandrodes]EZG67007.1 putative siderochrome-iron transporter [Gregarina niphandrodes]|eukprot:XP_011130394.1 putative siderochrome-iron transporter [Gregarina niphandrodes]
MPGGVGSKVEHGVKLQKGVMKAKRLAMYLTPQTLLLVYVGIFLMAMCTAVESSTTYSLLPYITSAFSAHSMMSTVQVTLNVMSTALKPLAAKVCDVVGRTEALFIAVVFYVIGYIVISVTHSIGTYTAAQLFYVAGQTSCLIIIQLIIADITGLANRVLLSVVPSTPYLVSGWIGPPLAEAILKRGSGSTWRLGIAMWAAILPVAASPLCGVLLLLRYKCGQKSRRNEQVIDNDVAVHDTDVRDTDVRDTDVRDTDVRDTESTRVRSTISDESAMSNSTHGMTWYEKVWYYLEQMDSIGTVMFAGALILLLVPLTLSSTDPTYFKSAQFISEIVCGAVLLALFGLYDVKFAKYPTVSIRMLRSPTVLAGCATVFFYFMAFYCFDIYLTSYFQVVQFATISQAGYAGNIFNVASTTTGIIAGLIIRFWKKWETTTTLRVSVLTGTTIYLGGIIWLAVACAKDGASFMVMLFAFGVISVGAGFLTTPVQAAVQSVVSHQEVAAVTSVVLCSTMLGGSVGTTIGGCVWTAVLPMYLRRYLPSDFDVARISEDMTYALSFPKGSVERIAINKAYQNSMSILEYIALGCACVVWLCALFIKPSDEFENNDRAGDIYLALDTKSEAAEIQNHEQLSLDVGDHVSGIYRPEETKITQSSMV